MRKLMAITGALLSILYCSLGALAVPIKYAQHLKIEPVQNSWLITVTDPWPDSKTQFKYLLTPKGQTPPPTDIEGLTHINVPLERAAIASSSSAAAIDALNATSQIIALSGGEYAFSPNLRDPRILDLGISGGMGSEINLEFLLSLKVDGLVTYIFTDSEQDSLQKMTRFGVPIILTASYREGSPLGCAEWIKFYGLLFGRHQEAQTLFDEVETNYLALKNLAQTDGNTPKVLLNAPIGGIWYVPRKDSRPAKIIEDANGEYILSLSGTTQIALDFETIVENSKDADYWLIPGFANLPSPTSSQGRKYRLITPYRENNVYEATARSADGIGNDYQESGFVRPDKVLKDTIKILHPQLLPDYELFYYKKTDLR